MKQKLVSLYKTIGGSSGRDVRTNGKMVKERERKNATRKSGKKQPYCSVTCVKFKNL